MSGATGDTRSPFHFNSVEMREAERAFRHAYPAFESTSSLDALRAREYARLDDLGQIYLDYTGGGLYAESQLREHFDLLRRHVFGNPHSLNPTSRAMTELVERARTSVLEFFQASPDEYAVIFTSNASHALKLVGEAYSFQPGGQFLLLFDNHNSVNGIREFARARGASFTYLPVMAPDLRIQRSPISPGCSILWSGSKRLRPEDGMSFWTVQPLCPPIAWICPGGIPILSRSRSTRCSGIRRV